MFLKLGRTWAWFHQHDILLSGFCCSYTYLPTILGSSNGKKSGHDAGNLGCIPGLRRFPGERHGNPLQYSCLENPHGQRILGGHSPWNRKELNMIEWLTLSHTYLPIQFSCSVVSDSLRPMDSVPGFPVHHQFLEPAQTHVHRVGGAIQPSHPLSSPSPTFNLSQHQGLFNESVLWSIKWQKYWSFSWSISPSNEYSELISFGTDWLDLPTVQETLKSLLQHHSAKASILWSSAFFIVQFAHTYMTTGKTIALTRQTFVGKVMSLLFNMLSRLVITFLPRSKHLLISWLQSPSAVILEPTILI